MQKVIFESCQRLFWLAYEKAKPFNNIHENTLNQSTILNLKHFASIFEYDIHATKKFHVSTVGHSKAESICCFSLSEVGTYFKGKFHQRSTRRRSTAKKTTLTRSLSILTTSPSKD